jgi:hypothetical protein
MTTPIPQPMTPSYQPPPGGELLSSKLTPHGSAVYSGIQGMSQFLSQWQQKREAKQQGEAANIAQNLMQAIQTGDTATAHEIMNDPKATKILNKVYKGWLTKAKESKKGPEPDVLGFEQGIKQYMEGKASQPPAMPAQMGGYHLPSAAPQQMQEAAIRNIQMQYLQQHPEAALAVSPREKVGIEEKLTELGMNAELRKTIASGYLASLRMAEEQDAIYQREIDVAKQRGVDAREVEKMREANRLEIEKLRGSIRKDIAGTLLGAKKGDKASNVAYQALNTLLRNATTRRDSLQSSYTQLVKAGNEDAAASTLTQISTADKYIDDINQQMQDLKDKDQTDKALMYIFGLGGEPSGD